ncbi:hypothetical protein GO755_11695 [Spirosoma sp. HMF4905]|uniref:Outer membrane beta-barrel protein n=1 Tax=Spirosoma arboris TaxID=2682092 RepID=A0A7K1SAX4_9BACT|nr:hypothetical protein [Spirosoma arboris]MVM30696.1 hypothetical protein [Spirosoma arboris]
MRSSLLLVLCGFWLSCPAWGQTDSPTGQPMAVKVSGGLNAYAGFYTANGIAARNQASPFGLSGSVTVALPGGISLPFSAVLGNQGSSFRQPFNQFGVSPTYKWATVHAGYRNVSFSPFTLAGHTFLGGGVELNPGNLRLGAVYGRFNKAISTNLAEPDIIPAYQRTGYALKVGYGKSGNYIDLLMLRAHDDSSSIASVPQSATQTVTPAENMVVGATSRLLIIKHITVELDAAVSAYTRDVRSTEVSAEGRNSITRFFGKFFTPRLSTQLTQATQAAIGYRTKNAGVKFQYKRIDPNFQTMGAYYFQSDIESYAIAPNLSLMNGKLRLSGSYGIQYDNLDNNKNARTGRTIGSLVVSYNPATAFGIDVQLSNYGISQQAGLRPVIDTVKLAQNNFSATVNTRYTIQSEEVVSLFTLSATRQQLSDLNQRTAAFTNNTNTNLNLGYFYQRVKSGLGANLLVSYTEAALAQGMSTKFYGPTLGATKNFLTNKLSTSVNASYLINKQSDLNGQPLNGQVINASANASYQIAKRQNVNLQLLYLNSDTGVADQRYNELRGTFGYGISF